MNCQGISLEQANTSALQLRQALIGVNAANAPSDPSSSVLIQDTEDHGAAYLVLLKDGWFAMVYKEHGKVKSFFDGSEGLYFPFSGSEISQATILSQMNAYYQAMGHSDPLVWDVYSDYVSAPGLGIRSASFFPTRNGKPFTREYAVTSQYSPYSGRVRTFISDPLPNVDTTMTTSLTVAQARPILVGYLFAHSNVTEAEETEYDVRLRWGKAPEYDEVNDDTYIPGPDYATLRATNTALLMYDVRYLDVNYTSTKGSGAYYRVIMDARNGQVVGMDGPVIAMFGGEEPAKPLPKPTWDLTVGQLSVQVGRKVVRCNGGVSALKEPGYKPKGKLVILAWGKRLTRASYDPRAKILWKRNAVGVAAGKPSPELRKVLDKLASEKP